GARVFGTTCFGHLFVSVGDDDLYLVDSQYGDVFHWESGLEALLEHAASDATREELFHQSLFRQWLELNGPLHQTDVLTPIAVLYDGGDWKLEKLQTRSLEVYLRLMAHYYGPEMHTFTYH